jgi:uncharacterized membrane protein/anaerobic ribonucleoside-triphosphate reductase
MALDINYFIEENGGQRDEGLNPGWQEKSRLAERSAAAHLSEQAIKPGDADVLKAIRLQLGKPTADKSEPVEPRAAATLDQNTLLKKAEALHEALNCKSLWGAGWSKPDVNRIVRELDPLNQTDRAALERVYAQKYGGNEHNFYQLRRDMNERLTAEASARAKAMLNRKDGRTNDAGQLNIALLKLDAATDELADNNSWSLSHVASDIVVPGKFLLERYENANLTADRVSADKQVRETIAGLNSQQLVELDKEYRAQFGRGLRETILADRNLSAETREVLKVYLRDADLSNNGIDRRSAEDQLALTEIAIRYQNLDMLGEALRGESPAAIEARAKFIRDNGEKQLQAAFSGDKLAFARDFIREGRISLATIASEDSAHWYHKNKEHLSQSLSNASEAERDDYAKGREIALLNKPAVGDEQQRQLSFYHKLHGALEQAAGSKRELSLLEDKLLRKGSLISELAESHSDGWWITGIGKGHDTGDLLSKVERMNEQDWQRLKSDPTFRRDIDLCLSTFAGAIEKKRADALLDRKAKAETYEQSKRESRTVLGTFKDETRQGWFGNTNHDGAKILDAIVAMSNEEQERYRADAQFKRQLDDKVINTLSAGPERMLAERLLSRIASGKELIPDGVEKVLLDSIKGAPADQLVKGLEAACKEDASLLIRLRDPRSAVDKEVRLYIESALTSAIHKSDAPVNGKSGVYEQYIKPLMQSGEMPFRQKLELAASKDSVYKALAEGAPAERTRLLNPGSADEKAMREQVFARFNTDERKILENVARQGKVELSDLARQFVLGFGSSYNDLRAGLQQIAGQAERIQELKNSYAAKYGRSLDDDLLSKVDEKERVACRNLLTPAALDGRQDFYDLLDGQMKSRSGLGDAIMTAGLWDGSRSDLDRALNENAAVRGQYARNFGNISPEKRQELIDQYARALKSYRESKGQMTDSLVNASLIAGSLAAAPLSGGASLSTIAAVATAGAVFKVGATSALAGNDFAGDPKTLAKLTLEGAFMTGLSMIGPAQFAAVFKIGDAAAAEAVTCLSTKLAMEGVEGAILKQGYETAGKKALASVTREALVSGRDLVAADFARVAEGLVNAELTGEARRAAVSQVTGLLSKQFNVALEQGERTLVTAILQGGRRFATETVSNSVVGATVSSASQLVAFPFDYNSTLSFSRNLDALGLRMKDAGFAGAAGGALFTGLFQVGLPVAAAGARGLRKLVSAGAEGGESVAMASGRSPRQTERPHLIEAAEIRSEGMARHSSDRTSEESLWFPEREINKLSTQERLKLYEQVRTHITDLVRDQPIDELVGKTLKLTSGWSENLTGLERQMNLLGKSVDDALSRYQNELVPEVLGLLRHSEMLDRQAVKNALDKLVQRGELAAADAPGKLAILDDLLKYRGPFASTRKELLGLLEVRRADIESVLNEFAAARNLPTVSVKLRPDLKGAEASYISGTINLRESALLNANNTSQLIESMYHEFVHHEQVTQLARLAMDRVERSSGRKLYTLGSDDVAKIREVFNEMTGTQVTPELLDKVCAARSGRFLSARESMRTEAMAEAFKLNSPLGDAYAKSGDHFRIAQRELQELKKSGDPNGAFKLIERLRNDKGVLSEHLFGTKTPPTEVLALMKTQREFLYPTSERMSQIDWPKEEADLILSATLKRRLNEINESRMAAYDNYIAGIHEKEAWLVGERARLRALRQGATAEDLALSSKSGANSSQESNVLNMRSREASNPIESVGRGATGVQPSAFEFNQMIRILDSKTDSILEFNRRIAKRMDQNGGRGGEALQVDLFKVVRGHLDDLKNSGQVSKDWEVFPTALGSPADQVGGDYLLINRRSGELTPLDVTSNSDKRNIAAIRADGVIRFEPKWIDQMGALRRDPSEPSAIRSAVNQFEWDLSDRLKRLTSKPMPLNLNEAPFPLAFPASSPAAAREQIEVFVQWLRQQANKHREGSAEKALFHDYANVLQYGALGYERAKNAKQAASPEFNQKVRSCADATVLDIAVRRTLGRKLERPINTAKSNVSVRDGQINLQESADVIHVGVNVEHVLNESRSKLFDLKAIAAALPELRMKQLRAAFPKDTERQLLERVRESVHETGRLIGTRTADNYFPLIDDLVSRLRLKTTEELLEIQPAVKASLDQPGSAGKMALPQPDAVRDTVGEFKTWCRDILGTNPVEEMSSSDVVIAMQMLLSEKSSNNAWTSMQLDWFTGLLKSYSSGQKDAIRFVKNALQ